MESPKRMEIESLASEGSDVSMTELQPMTSREETYHSGNPSTLAERYSTSSAHSTSCDVEHFNTRNGQVVLNIPEQLRVDSPPSSYETVVANEPLRSVSQEFSNNSAYTDSCAGDILVVLLGGIMAFYIYELVKIAFNV